MIHPGRLTWHLKTTGWQRKTIFQGAIVRVKHDNCPEHENREVRGSRACHLPVLSGRGSDQAGYGNDRYGNHRCTESVYYINVPVRCRQDLDVSGQLQFHKEPETWNSLTN